MFEKLYVKIDKFMREVLGDYWEMVLVGIVPVLFVALVISGVLFMLIAEPEFTYQELMDMNATINNSDYIQWVKENK